MSPKSYSRKLMGILSSPVYIPKNILLMSAVRQNAISCHKTHTGIIAFLLSALHNCLHSCFVMFTYIHNYITLNLQCLIYPVKYLNRVFQQTGGSQRTNFTYLRRKPELHNPWQSAPVEWIAMKCSIFRMNPKNIGDHLPLYLVLSLSKNFKC